MRARAVAVVAALAMAFAGLVGVFATSSASAASGDPVGAFDSVSARFDGVWGVSGWASDGDTPGQPLEVRLYFGATPIRSVATVDSRPDVAAAVPGAGPSTGWHSTIQRVELIVHGRNPLCAYAINAGAGTNTLLGCQRLPTSGSSPFNPRGSLDSASATPGLLRLKGWASDPDGDPTTQLRIYIDGELRLEEVAALARPDVANIGLSPTSGFDTRFPMLPGAHFVCVYAQNTGRAGLQGSTVGCVNVTIPGAGPAGPHDPIGSLDQARSSVINTNTYVVAHHAVGWAYDPDSAGPITVRIRAISRAESNTRSNALNATIDAPTGAPRPDVFAAHPQAGPSAGITPNRYVGGGRFSALSLMCAYAQNVGAGANRFLGCIAGSGIVGVPASPH